MLRWEYYSRYVSLLQELLRCCRQEPGKAGGTAPKDQWARAVGLTGQESRVEFLEQLRTGQASMVEFLEQLRLSDPCATPCSHHKNSM